MGFSYNVNVLNQKGSPAIYTDTFANRPSPGYAGRLFVSSDTSAIYEDTGTAWVLIANVSSGAGTLQQVTTNGNTSNVGIVISAGGLSTNSLTDTALTSGSVTFAGTGGLISQDNANLFWDDTNNRLGINTNTPGNSLDVHTGGTTPVLALNNTAGSQSAISFLNTSTAKWRIGNTATNTFDIHNFANGLTAISISGTNNAAAFNANILIAQSSTINQLAGYNAISGDSTGIYFFLGTSANRAYFVLSGLTAPQNYTLPNATGTLALTSDLSGYVPYSGATGAVNLGSYNLTVNQVVVGQGAGSGSGNVKCAINSLLSNTTGSANTSVGSNSLFNNTTGSNNTAVGNAALQSNVSGTQNSAFGSSTLISSTGSYNTGIGQAALTNNTTGSNNIGIGAGAGDVTTGSNNIFIGVNSTGTSATASNSTFIGTAATTLTWLGGNLLLGTKTDDGSGTKLQVTGSGKFSDTLTINSISSQNIISNSTASSGGYIDFKRSGITKGYLGNAGAIVGHEIDDIALYSVNALQFYVGNTSTTPQFKIASTGAGTFTGGVDGVQFTTNAGGVFKCFNDTNTNFWYTRCLVAGSNNYRFNYNGVDKAEINNSTGAFVPLSDINKKKDFEDSTIGLNAILGLKPTLFRMLDEEDTNKHLGFIAQEVKEFIPQAYVESGEGENIFIGLDYQAISSALVKAVQEQQTIINGLLQRIELIENK